MSFTSHLLVLVMKFTILLGSVQICFYLFLILFISHLHQSLAPNTASSMSRMLITRENCSRLTGLPYHGCLSLCLLMFSCYLQSLRDVSQSQGTFSSSNEPNSITTCSTDIIKMRRAGVNARRIKVNNKTLENTSIFIS